MGGRGGATISRAPRGTPPSPHNTPTSQLRIEYDATGKRRYSTAEGEEGRLLTLQQRLSLAKILEDNRGMGRRRVDSWRLSRSLEEARTHPLLPRAAAPTCAAQPPLHLPRAVQVAWVFNHYCANIRSETVDAGLEAWGGPDCAQFIRNVGLPQYDICFEGNMTGAKVRTRQAPSSPAEPLRPRRTGRHLQPWVMSGSGAPPLPRLVRAQMQSLMMSQLAQLGVTSFAHQKEVMKAVRLLLHACAPRRQCQTSEAPD